MSYELTNFLINQERIQNIQQEAKTQRELRAAYPQSARAFKFSLPQLLKLVRKPA